jgi:competence protein ComGF
VYTRLKNEGGFTIIEHLIGLLMLSVVVFCLPSLLQLAGYSDPGEPFDAQPFLNHVAKEAKEAELITWKDDALLIYKDGSAVSYEWRPQKRIQRFRDGKGVVIMAEAVERFGCEKTGYGLSCSITFENGKTTTRSFWTAKDVAFYFHKK